MHSEQSLSQPPCTHIQSLPLSHGILSEPCAPLVAALPTPLTRPQFLSRYYDSPLPNCMYWSLLPAGLEHQPRQWRHWVILTKTRLSLGEVLPHKSLPQHPGHRFIDHFVSAIGGGGGGSLLCRTANTPERTGSPWPLVQCLVCPVLTCPGLAIVSIRDSDRIATSGCQSCTRISGVEKSSPGECHDDCREASPTVSHGLLRRITLVHAPLGSGAQLAVQNAQREPVMKQQRGVPRYHG